MRDTFIVRRDDGSIVLSTKLKDIPYKEEAIAKKSLELFADDDPCVIHRSFVIMQFAEDWKKAFGSSSSLTSESLTTLLPRLNLPLEPTYHYDLIEG